MIHIFATLVLVSSVAGAAELSVDEYKAVLHANVRKMSEPMLELFSKPRADGIRAAMDRCRKSQAFKSCSRSGAAGDCLAATRCPYEDATDKARIDATMAKVEKEYEAIRNRFHAKLEGRRKRFSIGTMNRLIRRFEANQAAAMSELKGGMERLINDCASNGRKQQEPDAASVKCSYAKLDGMVEQYISTLESAARDLKGFAKDDLGKRIDGYKDKK